MGAESGEHTEEGENAPFSGGEEAVSSLLYDVSTAVAPSDVASLPDKELVELCKKQLPHNVEAYKEIIKRYEGLVYNTSLKIIGNPQEAEEVAQDSFLQIYHKLEQFEGRAAFKTWLFRIVYNFSIARREKMVKRSERQNNFAAEKIYESSAGRDTLPILKGQLSDTVQEAINRLRGDQRRIIILKFVTGLTLNEIAEVMGLKLSATKMRLYRALEEFKQHYLEITKDNPSSPE